MKNLLIWVLPSILLNSAILAEETGINEHIEDSLQYNFWNEFGKMSVILGLILISFFVLAWFLKRIMGKRSLWMNESSQIKIIERRPLSPKSALYLIEVEGKKVLIGESPCGIQQLSDVTPKADFKSILKADLI